MLYITLLSVFVATRAVPVTVDDILAGNTSRNTSRMSEGKNNLEDQEGLVDLNSGNRTEDSYTTVQRVKRSDRNELLRLMNCLLHTNQTKDCIAKAVGFSVDTKGLRFISSCSCGARMEIHDGMVQVHCQKKYHRCRPDEDAKCRQLNATSKQHPSSPAIPIGCACAVQLAQKVTMTRPRLQS